MPVAAAALGADVDVRVLKGRANYLCRRQLQGFQPFLLPDGRDAGAWEAMQTFLDETETGDRAELEVEPSAALWAELSVGPDRCSGRRCPFVSACFAEAARERASHADLVIVNHALYFAHLASGGGVLPEHDAVVFDEAHRLEESAASWLGGRVSRQGLRRLALDVERACREAERPLPARPLDRVERAGERLLRAVAPPSGRRRVARAARRGGARARRRAPRPRDSAARARGRSSTRCRVVPLATVAATSRPASRPATLERVVWSEPDAVAWAPVDVADELRERLWDEGPTCVLVSATLTTGEDAGFVRRRLGLEQAREAVIGSPYDFREQALLYLPRTMPDPRGEGFAERCAEEIVSLLALSEGRALVLTSSYRALEAYRDHVRGRVPYDVLVQGEAPRERLLERFRDRGRLGAARDLDVLAGRRRPRRVALAARDRQAAVLGARRPAARGPLRGGRAGGRRLVPRLRAPDARCCSSGRGSVARSAVTPTAASSRSSTRACARVRTDGRSSLRCRSCPVVEESGGRGGILRRARRRFRLNGGPMAAKKPKTPPPPRRVQAPKQRKDAKPDPAERQRMILYAASGAGIVALIAVVAFVALRNKSSPPSDAKVAAAMTSAGCTFKTVKAYVPAGSTHVASLTGSFPWNTTPPSNGQHYPYWAVWGFYTTAINPRQVVHNEEHGGVISGGGPTCPPPPSRSCMRSTTSSRTARSGRRSRSSARRSRSPRGRATRRPISRTATYGKGHIAICPTFTSKIE